VRALSQIYPKHKDLYNWVDVEHRVYVAYNVTYLQENFGYVSINSIRALLVANCTKFRYVRSLIKQTAILSQTVAIIGTGDCKWQSRSLNLIKIILARFLLLAGSLLPFSSQ